MDGRGHDDRAEPGVDMSSWPENGASGPRATSVGRRPAATRAHRTAIVLLALISTFSTLACSTRTVDQRIINRYGLDVYLRSDKKILGPAIDRGFEHPSDISVDRLRRILGSLRIERKEGARTVLGPAFAAELLTPISSGLAEGFREADANQAIVVMAQRKQRQKGIFNRKFLTSFVTYIEAGDLVVHLSRSDWPLDDNDRNQKTDRLPMPHVDDPQQRFRMVTNEFVHLDGKTGVRVAWNDPVFSGFESPPAAAGTGSIPPPPVTDAKPKTVLMEASMDELPEPQPLTASQIENLSPETLRELADLEEARRAGQLTEDDYRQKRSVILDRIPAN